jgi:protein SCO1
VIPVAGAPLTPAARHFIRTVATTGGAATILLAACMLCVSGAAFAGTPATDRVAMTHPPKVIEDFELTDQEGKPFRFGQLRGRPALLFFGFTHCPDVCPSTLAKLALLTDSANPGPNSAALVMISVDGDRDNAAAMKAYLAQLSPHCIGLTGDPRTVRRIAAQFSSVFFRGLPDKPGGPYLVEHTSQVYLIDRRGRLRASFFDASLDAMRRATAAIADEKAGDDTAAY